MKQGAIGIDFGSLQSIIAVANKGGVDIMLDEASSRETPNFVSYTEKERLIGQLGRIKEKQNFKNTIKYLNRFVDMKGDCPHLREERKWLSCKTSANKDNKIIFEISQGGENYQLLPEQVIASMFIKLKETIEKAGFNGKDIVLSVPSYFTEQQRKLILQAGRIAEINILRLFNESSAVALGYGIFRKKELTDEPKNVLFVDFGQSKLSTFVGQFTKKGMKICCQAYDQYCGVRDIDWELLKYYSKMFEDKEGISPMENKKAIIRLIDAIEKQRKILSGNKDAPINVECLLEDIDFASHLKREEFETIVQPVVVKIEACLNHIVEQMKAKKIENYDIEITGGGSRIPIFQETLEKFFKKQLLKTLHATECVSKGCAMMSAIISPLFHVTDYNIEEINYYNIKCSWQFLEEQKGMEIEKDNKNIALLFAENSAIPSVKSLTFTKNSAISFSLFYDPVPSGTTQLLSSYTIKKPKIKEENFTIKIRAKLDHNGIVSLQSAELNEDYVEEVKIPIKKEEKTQQTTQPTTQQQQPAEQTQQTNETQQQTTTTNQNPQEGTQQTQKIEEEKQEEKTTEQTQQQPQQEEFKIEKKKKTRSSEIGFETNDPYNLSEKDFQQLYQLESSLNNKDILIRETYNKKNEFESYIYYMKEKLQSQYAEYASSDIKKAFLDQLEKAESWLYSEGQHSSKGIYIDHIEKLKKVGDPIEKRFNTFLYLYEGVQAISNALTYWKNMAQTTDPLYEHITPAERQPIFDEITNLEKYQQELVARIKASPFHTDPKDKPEEIIKKNSDFCIKAKDIMSKKKPEPVKVESPKDQKTTTDNTKKEDKIEEENPKQNTQQQEKMDIEDEQSKKQ